ncbi:Na(+)-translocating NADH-quinone reductase subunit A [Elysia marginata]|uniref:Na(+)-translocating NADH-quinone reductase subunit A n=1 Tax=Elysia marginata TaxID=1093978 RepID=A0AAV4F0A6_9GAST|nr:Na(+)-translocating NADH-quinone reductase subunit A [Elysia marginata]
MTKRQNHIKIRKGFDIHLKGEADKFSLEAKRSKVYAVKPPDFNAIIPKLSVKEGQEVKAGETLFFSKHDPRIKFVSPVSGFVKEIVRGEKRKILSIDILAESKDDYIEYGKRDIEKISPHSLKNLLLESGCWSFIKQRPYDIIANPDESPKSVFISTYDSAPMAASFEYTLKDKKADFQTGIDTLKKLTGKVVHLSVECNSTAYFKDIKGVEIHQLSGPHPVGNVGVQIHKIDPINVGERVWTVSAPHVAIIGNLINSGHYDATKIIALCGSQIAKPHYLKVKTGAQILDIVGGVPKNSRIISGNVLTGEKVTQNDFLGFYHNEVTVIPEGNQYSMFGWIPFARSSVPSIYGTSISALLRGKKYSSNTNLNGEARAMVVTGKMESVFPFDIYPMQLLKECLSGNIDKMEALGIYEVVPEDFALVDFVSTSKVEAQEIIRKGLTLMNEEVG